MIEKVGRDRLIIHEVMTDGHMKVRVAILKRGRVKCRSRKRGTE